MKRHISAILAWMLTLVVAPGCVGIYDDMVAGGNGKGNSDFTVDVIAHDFDTVDSKTRAVQNGAVTKFENGDAFGLTFLDAQGNIVAGNDNLKFTFDKATGSWSTTGTPEYEKATSYIAYFPYSASCNGCKTESAVLAKFPIKSDQSSKADYIASDVLFAEGESSKNIEIKFKHLRTCFSFKVEIPLKGLGYSYTRDITDISSFRIIKSLLYQEYVGKSYRAEDGTLRAIVEPGTNDYMYEPTIDGYN